jgi:general secretion pathway protein N
MLTPQHLNASAAPWRWVWLGAGLGLVAAVLTWAPAHWLAWAVTQASQDRVVLQSARGSVWNGSAQLLLSAGQGSRGAQALPGRIHWQIEPGWLKIRLRLQADCCMNIPTELLMRVGRSSMDLQVDSHRSQWPAALLSGLGAPWNTLQPAGQLRLRTESLGLQWAVGRLQMQGLVELQAHNMSSQLSTLKPMGSYRIQLRGTPQGSPTPELFLSTTQGPLQLSGQGQWVGERLRFTGEASADEGSESALSNLLNIIGRRQGARSLLSLG